MQAKAYRVHTLVQGRKYHVDIVRKPFEHELPGDTTARATLRGMQIIAKELDDGVTLKGDAIQHVKTEEIATHMARSNQVVRHSTDEERHERWLKNVRDTLEGWVEAGEAARQDLINRLAHDDVNGHPGEVAYAIKWHVESVVKASHLAHIAQTVLIDADAHGPEKALAENARIIQRSVLSATPTNKSSGTLHNFDADAHLEASLKFIEIATRN